MSLVAKNIIEVDGWKKDWVFNSLSLRQSYNDHHVFEISVLVPQSPDKNNPSLTTAELTELLGKDIFLNIQIEALETPEAPQKSGRPKTGKNKIGAACHFEGFVDEVVPVWTPRACMLRITGYSKTIFMDCGPRFRTFYQQSVGEIVQKVMAGYSRKVPAPMLNGTGMQAGFSVQTQETDYRYLCRLADTYGKVFYFDGKQLHFGDLEKKEASGAIGLEFGEDLKQASVGLNIAPLNFDLGAYKIETNSIATYAAVNDCPNSHLLAAQAIKKSTVYPAPSMHLPTMTSGTPELKQKAHQLLAKQAHGLVKFTGISDLPSLKVGSKIRVTGTPEIPAQGEFIILEITHNVNSDRSYSNTFTAIPSGFPFPARMQSSNQPLCGPLMAIVKDHNDPDKLGRVRVEFIGDGEKTLSPWLRVLTPYTGFGGMYFLPEPEDRVVVQSEDFNIEKAPFVLGAFFQGSAKADQWYDPKNKKKGFTTEKVSFKIDDRTGKLTIEAEDIEIKARKTLKTGSEESEFAANRTMKIKAGIHLGFEAGRIDLNA